MLNGQLSPWPAFTDEEADAIHKILLSNKVNYWTGTETRSFETEFAAFAGTSHAIALANGTLALDLILAGFGIGAHYGGCAEDEVIVTPRSFMASVSTVVNAGATPVFADVDANSGNLTTETIAAAITPRTKAVIPVHLAGWPCDMDPIMALAETHEFKVIEDCAQAHGALYRGRSVGSIGHASAWSFCQDKIMTTGGEGGMVTTNNRDLWLRMWSFKDHGKCWKTVYEHNHPPGFRWLHESFGTNWRMMEMQAAIGRIQLKRMDGWTAAREANAAVIANAFAPFAGPNGLVRTPQLELTQSRHAQYKFYAYVRPENLAPGWNRDRIASEITNQGIPCLQGSCSEIYLEKAFDGTGWRPRKALPVAHALGETSLMMLVHPTLTQDEMTRTASAITKVLEDASHE